MKNLWIVSLSLLVGLTMASLGCGEDEPAGTVAQEGTKPLPGNKEPENGDRPADDPATKGEKAPTAAAEATATATATATAAASDDQKGAQKAASASTKTADNAQVAAASPAANSEAATKTAAPPIQRFEGPVALVNDKPIASNKYFDELEKIQKHGAKIPEERLTRIKDNILKRLIEAELVKQAVVKENVIVADTEIGTAYSEYKKRFKTDEQFLNYLKHGKLNESDIKNRIREKKALEKLINKKGSLTVGDQEAREFYDKNQRFYQQKEAVQASHILIKLAKDAGSEAEGAAKKKIDDVHLMIKRGQDFGVTAKKHSEGPSAPKGGDLGFFTRGQMVKAFEDKAFTMSPGEVCEPIRTRFGFHIIKVMERRSEKQKSFEEVKSQIFESLKNKKFFQERRQLLEQLRKEAKIEKKLS